MFYFIAIVLLHDIVCITGTCCS